MEISFFYITYNPLLFTKNSRIIINNEIHKYINETGNEVFLIYPGESLGSECLQHVFYVDLPFNNIFVYHIYNI